MERNDLVEALDQLCWSARRYGHDDYGLDGNGVDLNGNYTDNDDDDVYHPEAVALADRLIELGAFNG